MYFDLHITFCPLLYSLTKVLNRVSSGVSEGKESAYNVEDPGSVPGLKRSPGEWNAKSTPVFLLGEFHGQRSLMAYSPWGYKESDMTE